MDTHKKQLESISKRTTQSTKKGETWEGVLELIRFSKRNAPMDIDTLDTLSLDK